MFFANKNKYKVARHEFRKNGLCKIPKCVPYVLLLSMRQYIRHRLKEGALRKGDAQTSLRYIYHNDFLLTRIQTIFEKKVSDIVGKKVKSSYNYLAVYTEGAELPPHTDRPQCEYTLDLAIDTRSSHNPKYIWPLHVGHAEILLDVGDAALFKGRELKHYRNKLPKGNCITNVFFHYVDENFEGPLK